MGSIGECCQTVGKSIDSCFSCVETQLSRFSRFTSDKCSTIGNRILSGCSAIGDRIISCFNSVCDCMVSFGTHVVCPCLQRVCSAVCRCFQS